MTSNQTFGAVIITLDQKLRPPLSFALQNFISPSHIVVFQGRVPYDFGCLPGSSHLDTSCHTNSKLSCIEHAISHSHFLARTMGVSLNTDWVLILEDDCILLDNFKEFEEFLSRVNNVADSHQALAIHLFPEQFGILKMDFLNSICEIKRVPDCAMAYALNKTSLSLCAADDTFHYYVADWPPLLRKLHWFSPITSFARHPDLSKTNASSTTTNSRDRRIALEEKSFRQLVINRIKVFPFFLLALFLRRFGHNPIQAKKLRSLVYGR